MSCAPSGSNRNRRKRRINEENEGGGVGGREEESNEIIILEISIVYKKYFIHLLGAIFDYRHTVYVQVSPSHAQYK
jgi:hypothetical protein